MCAPIKAADIAAARFHQLGDIKEALDQNQSESTHLTAGFRIQQELILVVDFQPFPKWVAPVLSIRVFLFRHQGPSGVAQDDRLKSLAVFFHAPDLKHQAGMQRRAWFAVRSRGQKATAQIAAGGGGYAAANQFRVIGVKITAQVDFDGAIGSNRADRAVRRIGFWVLEPAESAAMPCRFPGRPSTRPSQTCSSHGPADAASPGRTG